VKIDKSLVDGVAGLTRAAARIAEIIEMAHARDLAVVAEAVEYPEQAEALRELHCDFGQGYYFGRPLPAESLVGPGRVLPEL
jgi:EAL domain-containing protein (putative c-di-GMP-specific phosphodiesterase class I)